MLRSSQGHSFNRDASSHTRRPRPDAYGETDVERLQEARVLLDEPADEDFLLDQWKSWGSPQGKAYDELFDLDLGLDPRLHRGIGSLDFIDSPSLGYYACSVELDGCLSLSLLQGRLNELGTGFRIEIPRLP